MGCVFLWLVSLGVDCILFVCFGISLVRVSVSVDLFVLLGFVMMVVFVCGMCRLSFVCIMMFVFFVIERLDVVSVLRVVIGLSIGRLML